MRRIVLLAFIVPLALSCMGQTTPLGVTLLASDGNLYGLDESLGFFSYNLTTGASTILNSKYTTQNTTLCLERPDETLLAISGPFGSRLTAVSLTLAGVSTALATFPPGQPACPAMANDGNYYGASGTGGKYENGYLYQLGSHNVITDFYDFTGGVDGSAPLFSSPVQGSDGNLYFTHGNNLLRCSTVAGAVPLATGYPLSRGGIFEGADGNLSVLRAAESRRALTRCT